VIKIDRVKRVRGRPQLRQQGRVGKDLKAWKMKEEGTRAREI